MKRCACSQPWGCTHSINCTLHGTVEEGNFIEPGSVYDPYRTQIKSIADIQRVSKERAELWHKGGMDEWSSLEWAGAMCGEAGEAANIAKKIRRHDLEANYNKGSTDFAPLDRPALVKKYAQELADTFLYLVLCAEREGINLEQAIIDTFNDKSIEAGFPQRIG